MINDSLSAKTASADSLQHGAESRTKELRKAAEAADIVAELRQFSHLCGARKAGGGAFRVVSLSGHGSEEIASSLRVVLGQAADELGAARASLAAERAAREKAEAENKRIADGLQDANVVHVNMLRGGMAKLTWDQVKHLYAGEFAAAEAALTRIKEAT